MHAALQDMGAQIGARFGTVEKTATAGGTGDATEVAAAYVNMRGLRTVKALVYYQAVLGEDETLTFEANWEEDADGTGTGVDYGTALAATQVAVGAAGGSTESGVMEIDLDNPPGAKQYVRVLVKPNLSAANTDTLKFGVTYVVAGGDNPVGASLT